MLRWLRKDKEMEQIIWLSYDLGVRGDYESLYIWLDFYEARECGDSFAALHYEYKRNLESEIKKDLKESVNLRKSDRIYLIYEDDKSGKLKGKFIIGRRKRSPWEGFAESYEEVSEDGG